jgi:hypothetical protein
VGEIFLLSDADCEWNGKKNNTFFNFNLFLFMPDLFSLKRLVFIIKITAIFHIGNIIRDHFF